MNYFGTVARILPLALSLYAAASIFLTYLIAVYVGHVAPVWPYVSDTGTKPPESCIFTFLLSIVAFCMYLIIYIRYLEVTEYSKLRPSAGIKQIWNTLSFLLGVFSATGLLLVASFQEENQFTAHLFGALLCFSSAILFFLSQTIFTRIMHPEEKLMFWIRITFTALNCLFFTTTFAAIPYALKEFKGTDYLKWTAEDGGYTSHLISTFSEWLMIFSFSVYVSTFYWDFRKMEFETVQIRFISLENETHKSETTSRAGAVPSVVGSAI